MVVLNHFELFKNLYKLLTLSLQEMHTLSCILWEVLGAPEAQPWALAAPPPDALHHVYAHSVSGFFNQSRLD